MKPIRLSSDVLHDFERGETFEWLETNGLGGFASQTVLGSHGRRYHGLSFFPLKGSAERTVFLSRVEETLVIDGAAHALSVNRFENAVSPEGHKNLDSFALDPFPIWTYRIDDVVIEKTFFLVHGKNEAILRYCVKENPRNKKLSLEIRPLVACRPIHAAAAENPTFNTDVVRKKGVLLMKPYETLPPLSLSHNAAAFDETSAAWYKNFAWQEEKVRGYDHHEDLRCIGTLTYELSGKKDAYLRASIGTSASCTSGAIAVSEKKERARRKSLIRKNDDEFLARLHMAADQFLVTRNKTGMSIIAGYHWFSDYGRDAFISVPGLLLSRGLMKEAKQIVLTILGHMNDGIVPNRFIESTGEPEYNTVDATLWVFRAVEEIMKRSKDLPFLRKVIKKLEESIRWHEQGTHHGIRIDEKDGLLAWNDTGYALTWMDAVVDHLVITPRTGKAVEVNALWYAALRSMHDFYKLLGARERAEEMSAKADLVRESFRATFWDHKNGRLYDCIDPHGNAVSEHRPNQIFAISLSDDLLTDDQQAAVLESVTKDLLTPVGLRSLSPHDKQYIGRYEGNHLQRDTAYHQGTTWGWLIGPYIDAYLCVHGKNAAMKKKARELLKGFEDHFHDAGIGQLSEIFDGDAPYAPRGCIAQAWTVGEILRVMEEIE